MSLLKEIQPVENWYQCFYKGESINYLISKDGRIKSIHYRNKKELTQRLNPWNYLSTRIIHKGKVLSRFTHTLLAHTFLELPVGYTYDTITVNHKDGNKLNNNVENLEYCTTSANNIHKFDFGMQYRTRGAVNTNVYKFTNDDGRTFEGTPRALFYAYGEQDKLFMSGINQAIRGYSITTGWNCSHHKGWRAELLRERTREEFKKEMQQEQSHIYTNFLYSDKVEYRTKTVENQRIKRAAVKELKNK
jgi:hypothetical protein